MLPVSPGQQCSNLPATGPCANKSKDFIKENRTALFKGPAWKGGQGSYQTARPSPPHILLDSREGSLAVIYQFESSKGEMATHVGTHRTQGTIPLLKWEQNFSEFTSSVDSGCLSGQPWEQASGMAACKVGPFLQG